MKKKIILEEFSETLIIYLRVRSRKINKDAKYNILLKNIQNCFTLSIACTSKEKNRCILSSASFFFFFFYKVQQNIACKKVKFSAFYYHTVCLITPRDL